MQLRDRQAANENGCAPIRQSPNKQKRQCSRTIDRIQVEMIVQSSEKRRECRGPGRKCAGSNRSGRRNEVGSSPLRSLTTFGRSLALVAAPGAGWRNWLQLSITPRLFQRWFWWSGQAKEWTRYPACVELGLGLADRFLLQGNTFMAVHKECNVKETTSSTFNTAGSLLWSSQ